MQVNRKKGPPITPIRKIKLPEYQAFQLDNGIPVYYINQGTQELIKFDMIFEGGRHTEQYRTQSRAHSAMIKEGTSKKSSEELSQFFDFYGASYNTKATMDHTSISLFCLTRHFERLSSQLSAMILDPIFPQDEIQKFINTSQQKLTQALSKNEIVAYREMTSKIFGSEHIYGYNSSVDDYALNNHEQLKAYHEDMLNHRKCFIFISGFFNEKQVLSTLNRLFGQTNYQNRQEIVFDENPITLFGESRIPSKNQLQIALRMGKRFGGRSHPKYGKMAFLSNVFGGFFGSRLMKNIREDKGYTYNIFSDLDTMKYDGYFYISTELDKEYFEPAKNEIFREMEILQNELISEKELNMNKNYIIGNFLNATDGPFQAIRLIKSIVLQGRDREDLDKSISEISNMTSEEIRDLARDFFQKDEFSSVVVG